MLPAAALRVRPALAARRAVLDIAPG